MHPQRRFIHIGNLVLAVFFGAVANLPAANLIHRYSFTADANDSVGAANGALLGGATISSGAVVLNGSGAYVDLPNGIVSTLSNVTFEVWLTDNNSGNWARIIDFGCSTGGDGTAGTGTNYLFLCPQSGAGNLRAAITPSSNGNEQQVNSASRLPAGSLKHVVWTIDAAAQNSRLYVDGALVAENAAMTLNPATLGNTFNNWIGRSQFSGDAYLTASITEFRIYDGALTALEIQQDFAFGPDVAANGPVGIFTQPQSQTVVEHQPATFSVVYNGTRPVSLQWFRDHSAIPGATNASYTIASVELTNNGVVFNAALTNSFTNVTFTVVSSNAVLTVTADTNPPVLLSAERLDQRGECLLFGASARRHRHQPGQLHS